MPRWKEISGHEIQGKLFFFFFCGAIRFLVYNCEFLGFLPSSSLWSNEGERPQIKQKIQLQI